MRLGELFRRGQKDDKGGEGRLNQEQQVITSVLQSEADRTMELNGSSPELWIDPNKADALLVLERDQAGTVRCVRVTGATVLCSTTTKSNRWEDVLRLRGFDRSMSLNDKVALAASHAGAIPDPGLTEGWRRIPMLSK